MDIHLKAVSEDSNSSQLFGAVSVSTPTQVNEVELCLTINFNGEQEIEVPGGKRLGGRVTFGIRRGQLRFVLQNCHLPLDKTALTKPFKVSINVETQKSRNSELQAGASPSAKAAEGVVEKTTVEVFQVKKTGSDTEPAWIFETQDERATLEGMLTQTLLGTLQVAETPCRVSANFTARCEDVRITWGKIGTAHNIHRNKLALIERAIALRYIQPLVKSSPLCEGSWQHG